MNDEHKAKISKALKGRPTSTEHRINLSKSLSGNTNRRGKKQSPEEIANRVKSRLRNGKRMSKEAKLKMRKARLKNPNMYWVGRKRPEATRRKISNNLSGKYRGEKNPSWKGGKWRWIKREAKIRDNNTCQVCGLKDEEIMEVDHIKPRSRHPSLIFVLENLVTLCPNCHRRKTLREYKEKIYARK